MGHSMLSVHSVRAIVVAPPIEHDNFASRDVTITTGDGEVTIRLFSDVAASLRLTEESPALPASATVPGGV